MSSQGSKTRIGIFVLGAIGLAVVAVVLFGSGQLFSQANRYIMYFDRSVAGLSVGSAVTFRGVRIGSVREIRLEVEPSNLEFSIPVLVEIFPEQVGVKHFGDANLDDLPYDEVLSRLVGKGMRGVLQQQSFVTGQLNITLDYYPDKAAVFRGDGSIPEIPTVPSAIDEIATTLEELPLNELVSQFTGALNGINAFFTSPGMQELPVEAAGVMTEARAVLGDVRTAVAPLATQMNATLQQYALLAANVDSRVAPVSDELAKTMQAYQGVAAELSASLRPLEGTLTAANRSLENLEELANPRSPVVGELRRTLQEVQKMTNAIRELAEYLERHPESLLRGKR